ncbi:MAG: hypothetical protein Q4E54_08570 [Lachnospiraceae bacterium]|nr:hypothetical protein [Lachnospiraceae bacterium]
MVYAIIDISEIQPLIALIIIIGFAVFGAVKGLYGLISPVVAVILSLITGIMLTDRMDLIADSRLLTFIIMSAIAWGIISLVRKLGDKISNWFVIGWINHLTGFFAGALIGLMVQSFIFNIIKFFGGNLV